MVQTPNNEVMKVIIPDGCLHGHTFFVRVPDEEAHEPHVPAAVNGISVNESSNASDVKLTNPVVMAIEVVSGGSHEPNDMGNVTAIPLQESEVKKTQK